MTFAGEKEALDYLERREREKEDGVHRTILTGNSLEILKGHVKFLEHELEGAKLLKNIDREYALTHALNNLKGEVTKLVIEVRKHNAKEF